jgi:uroporphyrinogen-III decarboxylase
MDIKERIKKLADEVREISESAENSRILRRWGSPAEDVGVTQGASVWHGIPYTPAGRESVIPYTIDPEIVLWSKILGFNMREYYQDPLCYLENSLKTKLFRYRTFADDSYMTKEVSIFIGVILEPSMFGISPVYPEDRDPWNDTHAPAVRDEADLENLKQPDFHSSGIMPLAHRFYSEIKEALPDDFSVAFPIWGRGPWGVAQHLAGFENLMLWTIDQPEFVHRLMGFIADAQCRWLKERADFLGIGLPIGVMYNDEVNCQLISPDMYREFIFPYEEKVAAFQNGISYWHSCGNTGPILKYVLKLPGLMMQDVSAWTDHKTASQEIAGTGIAAEVRLHPVQDVLYADEAHIRAQLKTIREVFQGIPLTVRADGMQLMGSVEHDVEKIRQWGKIASELLRLS